MRKKFVKQSQMQKQMENPDLLHRPQEFSLHHNNLHLKLWKQILTLLGRNRRWSKDFTKIDLSWSIWLAGIVVANPAGAMYVCCQLWMLCVLKYRTLPQAAHSSRGVLPNVVWLNECDHKAPTIRRHWPTRDCLVMKKKLILKKSVMIRCNWCVWDILNYRDDFYKHVAEHLFFIKGRKDLEFVGEY
jgi:hypothetical protein